jgi:hypothetical protein
MLLSGPVSLTRAPLAREELFVQAVTEKRPSYALGRAVG